VRRILLVGAGHAHLAVLRSLSKESLYGARVTLVTPRARQVYSGMLPGVVAGHYSLEEAQIDIEALCGNAFVEFLAGRVDALDVAARRVSLDDGSRLDYDAISLNPGSLVERSLPGAERTLPVKPLDEFLAAIDGKRLVRVAIVGAGAAGAELAMALAHRGAAVTLYSDRPTVPGVASDRVELALRRARVDFRPGMAVSKVEEGPTIIAGASRQDFDLVILATGSAAPAWIASSGLTVDGLGFGLVHDTLQSVSHPEVFISGDCATVRDAPHPRSGVYAVRHGESLATNFRNLVGGKPLQPYIPQARALVLLTCGARYAIAQRGGWTAEGAWVWRWKDWVDRRWLRSLSARG
jgi:pyridine nucleotide-disulfide oxidoreductase family protein